MGFICAFRGHLRDTRRTWHDRIEWRSSCVRCGVPMIKDRAMNRWREFDREKDYSTARKGKPEK
jgi:hypothetical protein